MANKVVASLGAGCAGFLAFLWLITLMRPWTWLWSDNQVVLFKVNLFSIRITKGTLGHGLSIIGGAIDGIFGTSNYEKMAKLFNQAYWMEEGVQELCMVGIDQIWHWCEIWVMVKYASMIFIFLGFLTAIFLGMGGAFMYYYAHHHATHTGRMWIRSCFITAPCLAWVGLLQYVLLTFQLGKSERQILVDTHAGYGPGFIVACALTVLSILPMYVHGVYTKVDDFEKHGDNDEFMESPNPMGPPFGSAQAPMQMPNTGHTTVQMMDMGQVPGAYGVTQQPQFGLQPVQQPMPYNAAPQMGAPPPLMGSARPMAYATPGSGAPAW
uniref:Uncharacterized protein n=1 Tax=Alexandrium catenella TaxID=2925 RepID=A0A7S1QN86_ALECA